MIKITVGTRKGGFTLVELLVVTVIIGILAGMLLMMMGSASDSAAASKIIYDLRLLKSASTLYFAKYEEWPSTTHHDTISGAVLKSLDECMDKPFSANYFGSVFVAVSQDRIFYGLSPDEMRAGVLKKLQKYGGVYDDTGSVYGGVGEIYMIVR